MSLKRRYSAVAIFSNDLERIVLIHKLKPDWQAGKANLPGGKVDAEQDYLNADDPQYEGLPFGRRGVLEMNIFVLDGDPARAAQALCDQHVGKMLLEACQLLCNCHAEAPYKRTHYSHPCSVWARASLHNYLWLRKHALALADEYEHRFGKVHGSRAVAIWAAQHLPSMLGIERTSFAQAMPDQYRGPDAVAAYRRYYAAEKMILRGKPVTWTRRERPAWLPE